MITELKDRVSRWNWDDEFVGCEMADYYEAFGYNDRERCAPATRLPLMILVGRVMGLWETFMCAAFGHDYDSYADAENGYESVSCNRCGWGFDCYH